MGSPHATHVMLDTIPIGGCTGVGYITTNKIYYIYQLKPIDWPD